MQLNCFSPSLSISPPPPLCVCVYVCRINLEIFSNINFLDTVLDNWKIFIPKTACENSTSQGFYYYFVYYYLFLFNIGKQITVPSFTHIHLSCI